jgi:hypothetical protein
MLRALSIVFALALFALAFASFYQAPRAAHAAGCWPGLPATTPHSTAAGRLDRIDGTGLRRRARFASPTSLL